MQPSPPSRPAALQTHSNHVSQNGSNLTFTEQDRCLLRLQKIMKRDARDVLHYVFLLGTRDRDVTKPLDSYLFSLGFTVHQLRARFNKSQREKFLSDYDGHSYDVSLLWTCIMLTCFRHDPKLFWVTSYLESLISAIKNFRNTMMHDGFTGSQTDFMQEMEKIRKTLIEILTTAGEVYGVDDQTISQKVQNLNLSINKVRDDSFDSWDITSYQNENLFSLKLEMILSDGVQELRSLYSQWSCVTPVTFLFDDMQLKVDAIYTSLSIVKGGPEGCNQEINYEDIIQYAQTSNTQTSLSNVAQIILLEGVSGSGKSTLAKVLMSQWIAKKSAVKGLADFDLLIYVECRNSSLTTFSHYLSSLMPKTASSFMLDDLLKCVLNLRLLMIVDGLDELNENSSSFLAEILQLKRTVDITIFCTTRPEKVKQFWKLVPEGFQVTSLVIMGVPESRRIDFVLKYYNEMKKTHTIHNTEGLTRFLTSSSLRDHWRLPLNLMLVAMLWAKSSGSKEDSLSTTTKLYIEFQRITKEKLICRIKGNEKTRHLENLEEKLEKFLSTLYWEALRSLGHDDIFLPDESTSRLRDACISVGLPCEEVFGAFFMQMNTWTSSGPHTRTSFFHKGMQDFYAALFILKKLNNEMTNVSALIQGFQNVMALHNIQDDVRQEITKTVSDIFTKYTTLPSTSPSSRNTNMGYSNGKCNYVNCSSISFSESPVNEISLKLDKDKDCSAKEKNQESTYAHFDDNVAGVTTNTVGDSVENLYKESTVSKEYTEPASEKKAIRSKKQGERNIKTLIASKTLCLKAIMTFTSYMPTAASTSEVKRDSATQRTMDTSTPRCWSIARTLEELSQGKIKYCTMNKYQNMLLHLGGLLHNTSGKLEREIAEELVTMLVKSNLQSRRQWIDLLSEVECDDETTCAVVRHVPTLVNGLVEVEDTTVDVYAALLRLGCPSAVKIRIKGDAEKIPRLHNLLKVLANERTPLMLYFWKDFQHARHCQYHNDMAHDVFSRCHVTKFSGCLDRRTATCLPNTLEGLSLAIVDDQHYKELTPVFTGLLSAAPRLCFLWLHITTSTDFSILQPLPHIRDSLRLYLSHVGDSDIKWVAKTCLALKPPSKEYTNLRFPRSDLTTKGCRKLVQALKKAQVRLAFGGVWVSSAKILHEEEEDVERSLKTTCKDILGCNFRLTTEDEIWSS
nr:uncharacterized protein LOC113817750 [Penaeus vannamei]XP_027225640.1 uncharacterized protein LOC113817750 [Penaeus vannamei]XP_027225641.1 uncharacterized protein LOC113817750 [Penaeus vannamei]